MASRLGARALPRRLSREQSGFTLFEVLMAALITAVGIMAVVGTFDSSRKVVSLAERNETATHQAEQELERILSMSYASVGLTGAAPSHVNDVTDPRYFVVNPAKYQWEHNDPTKVEDLVTTGGGTLAASSTWQDPQLRLSGEIWRFVTWVWDPNIVQSPDKADAKRVTVAVTVAGKGGPTKPVVLSTIVYDKFGS
jgi:type II secretory pathway pseudopilin PulG